MFNVTHALAGDVTRVQVAGELDMATAPQLNSVIDSLVGDGRHQILVDLTELSFCDSTGLAAFVRGNNLAAPAGGWLRLTGATGRVSRVLAMSGLEQVLSYEQDTGNPTAVGEH